jgi:hypothetical protein
MARPIRTAPWINWAFAADSTLANRRKLKNNNGLVQVNAT